MIFCEKLLGQPKWFQRFKTRIHFKIGLERERKFGEPIKKKQAKTIR